MPSFQFLSLFWGQLAKRSMVTSVPLSLLLVGLQAMIDVKFSCPCNVKWNNHLIALIFIAPITIALVIMILLLRPFHYECSCNCSCKNQNNSGRTQGQDDRGTTQGKDDRGSTQGQDDRGTSQGQDNRGTSQGQDNRGTTQGQDNRGTTQGQDNRGTSQGQDKKETSQSEINELEANLSCGKASLVCLIPSLVWLCLCLMDGDYIACGQTYWNGLYTCDKELHPYCLNWCKPNKLSQGKNETEYYEETQTFIARSKLAGYYLAIIFCLIAIVIVGFDWCKSGKSKCCRKTDPESQSHGRQDPDTDNQQRNDKSQTNNTDNAPEHVRLLTTPL
ncbi:uncharacterized protein LOC131529695 [Onychostoma macrolepis]|uniref:uncharacterized protein LOC131529695 n=1 Tax=Onychostoma macrolepis TaxID=369639 RepID=UPI00272B59BC|nr:uncharacterized protein LOC131529695 [Onychostoma macrolepis]XP_058615499.1 uncharacterized protein LOC131529695 [Onychostoma macrolepis]